MMRLSALERHKLLLAKEHERSLEALDPSLRILASPEIPKDISTPNTLLGDNPPTPRPPGEAGKRRRTPPLCVYKYPPEKMFFDVWALQKSILQRLSILMFLSRVTEDKTLEDDFFCRQVMEQLEQAGFFFRSGVTQQAVEAAFEYDRLSHFFLRVAYVNGVITTGIHTNEMFYSFSLDPLAQEWFVQQEVKLLRVKLSLQKALLSQTTEEVLSGRIEDQRRMQRLKPILNLLGIQYTMMVYNPSVSAERSTWDRLLASFPHQRLTSVVRMPWWPYLAYHLKRHRCYLQDGYGYIPFHDIDTVILGTYRRFLSDALVHLQQQEHYIKNHVFTDSQIGLLLQTIGETNFIQNQSTVTGDSKSVITLENLDELYKECFPPCMKHLYLNFKKDHHLKHWGRLQLWLFLKSGGMALETQLSWWRSLWHDPQKFDKEIKYNLRHAYGLEGKRADYPAFSCSKILNSNPSPGNKEYHGCPFQTFSVEPLKRFLQTHYPLTGRDLDSVLTLKNSHQYQLACRELFVATHPGLTGDTVGNHPNTYFEECCKHRSSRKNNDADHTTDS